MEFRLTINMDNAAFGEDDHDRRYELRRIFQRLLNGQVIAGAEREGAIRDSSGNRVGEWSIS